MDFNPLIIPAEIFPEMNESDRANELDLMIERAIAFQKAIDGNLPANQLLEILDEQEYDIDEFIDELALVSEAW